MLMHTDVVPSASSVHHNRTDVRELVSALEGQTSVEEDD